MNETPENPQPDQSEPTQPPAPPSQPEPVQPPAPYQPQPSEPAQPQPPAPYQPESTPPSAPSQPEPVQPPAPYQPQPPVSDPYAQPTAPAYPGAAPVDPNAYPAAPQGDPNAYPAAPHADPHAYPGAAPADPYAAASAPGAYPGAAPAYPGAAAPTDPNAPYAGAYPAAGHTPAPRKPMSKGLLFGLIGGGAVVVLAIAAAVIVPIVTRPVVPSASEYVEQYLTALSDGDAEKALTFVTNNGDDDALLSEEVLKASLKLGAIDKIKVGKESDGEYGDTQVAVTFNIGDTKIERTFDVSESYEGDELTIVDGLATFSGLYGFEGLGLTVNGVEAPADYAYVFPGTYELAIGPEEFAIEGESTVVIADDDDSEALYDVKPILSEAGTATFRQLVSASFAECLAMKTLDTPCGMNTSDMSQDGYAPVDGTVTRTIDAENQSKIDNLEPYVSERAIVTTYDYWSVHITLDASNGSSTEPFEVLFGGSVLTPKVDFSAETPAVIWE